MKKQPQPPLDVELFLTSVRDEIGNDVQRYLDGQRGNKLIQGLVIAVDTLMDELSTETVRKAQTQAYTALTGYCFTTFQDVLPKFVKAPRKPGGSQLVDELLGTKCRGLGSTLLHGLDVIHWHSKRKASTNERMLDDNVVSMLFTMTAQDALGGERDVKRMGRILRSCAS